MFMMMLKVISAFLMLLILSTKSSFSSQVPIRTSKKVFGGSDGKPKMERHITVGGSDEKLLDNVMNDFEQNDGWGSHDPSSRLANILNSKGSVYGSNDKPFHFHTKIVTTSDGPLHDENQSGSPFKDDSLFANLQSIFKRLGMAHEPNTNNPIQDQYDTNTKYPMEDQYNPVKPNYIAPRNRGYGYPQYDSWEQRNWGIPPQYDPWEQEELYYQPNRRYNPRNQRYGNNPYGSWQQGYGPRQEPYYPWTSNQPYYSPESQYRPPMRNSFFGSFEPRRGRSYYDNSLDDFGNPNDFSTNGVTPQNQYPNEFPQRGQSTKPKNSNPLANWFGTKNKNSNTEIADEKEDGNSVDPKEANDPQSKLVTRRAVDLHNMYREAHNAQPLSYDEEIAKVSQAYAVKLAKTGTFGHNPQCNVNGYGENLAYFGNYGYNCLQAVENAIKDWYNEIHDYDYENGQHRGKVGHFTQLVWRNSSRLGMGVGIHGTTIMVVANYAPCGNILGYERQNVLPPNRSL